MENITVQTEQITTPSQTAIEALTVASEFLQCSIRAIAYGAPVGSPEALQPLEWAKAKLSEIEISKL